MLPLALLGLLAVTLCAAPPGEDGAAPKRKTRAESFLGVHFDFHANPGAKDVGAGLTEESIRRVIEEAKPDYIQVDCKGHPGVASYPTDVGVNPASFAKDPLRLWRDVTAAHGVALYLHFSGIRDHAAVQSHPEWARLDEKGKPDDRHTTVFGDYVKKSMIPQLEEAIGRYGVDGIWVDGECWAVKPDYHPDRVAEFLRRTGAATAPVKPGDPFWFEFMEMHRQGFRDYLATYVNALHRSFPGVQITSNWAYSSHMPEPVTIPLDYLSGDLSPRNAFNSARIEARILSGQSMPWDLMAWSFSRLLDAEAYHTKSALQLQHEAAQVLAQGGGVQVYFMQGPDGSVREWEWDAKIMADVAAFCRARQSFSHRSEPVPHIAVLYSSDNLYRHNTVAFGVAPEIYKSVHGITQALLDAHHPVDLLSEHQILPRINEYKLIVIPECRSLTPDFVTALLKYVREGGNLLAVGPASADLFREPLKLEWADDSDDRILGLWYRNWMAGVRSSARRAKCAPDAHIPAELFENWRNNPSGPSMPAACIVPYGRGHIAAIFADLGKPYLSARSTLPAKLLSDLASELVPEPLVKMENDAPVEIVLRRMSDDLMIHLINIGGPHEDPNIHVYEHLPETGPVRLTVRSDKVPDSLALMPGGDEVRVERHKDGTASLLVPRVAVHEVLRIPGAFKPTKQNSHQ